MSQLGWKFQNQLVVNKSDAWDRYTDIYAMEWYVLKDMVCKSIFLLHSIILIYIIYPFGSHWKWCFLGTVFWTSIASRMRSFLSGWRPKIRAGSFKPRDRKWRPTSLWLLQCWKMNCSHSKLPFQRHFWKFGELDISSMGCLDLKRIHESSPNFLGCGRLLIPADVIAAFLGGKKMQRYAKAF